MAPVSTPRTSRPYLRRARLSAVLDRGEPITVLRAPMGFGKTALVADWVSTQSAERQDSTIWITADPEWEDPTVFWADLQRSLSDIGVPSLDDRPGPAAVRASLAVYGKPVTLIVDAVDRLATTHVPSGLLELLRRAPTVQLIVCTRARALERSTWLDIDGAVLTADELALTEQESGELLRLFGIDLDADALRSVVDGVLGWPLALRAVALAVTGAGGAPDVEAALAEAHRQLRDSVLTFVEEAKLGPIAFPASLLAEFTGKEFEDAVDVGFGVRMGEELAAAGLVMAEAGEAVVYRWPPIIRQIVADEFEATDPERVRELNVQLADYYIANDVPLPSLLFAARARDWLRVEQAIGRMLGRLIVNHREELRAVFAQIPLEAIPQSVVLSGVREYLFAADDGTNLISYWNLPESTDELRQIALSGQSRQMLNEAGLVTIVLRRRGEWDRALAINDRISRLALVLRTEHIDQGTACGFHLGAGITYMHLDQRDQAARSYRMAYRDGSHPAPGLQHAQRDAGGKLALLHAVNAEMGRAEGWLERSADAPLANVAMRPGIEGNRAAASVLIAVERGDMESVIANFPALLATPTFEDFWPLSVHAHARAALLRRDFASVLPELTSSEARQRRDVAHPWIAGLLLADEVDVNLALGNGTRARALLDSAPVNEASTLVARARVSLIAGDVESALEDARATPMADHTSLYWELQAQVILAVGLHRTGSTADAVEVLTAAIRRPRSDGAYAAFATVPRAELSAILADVTTEVVDVVTLLERMPEMFPASLSSIALTGRERVILGYLDAGLTLNAIARRETVSINTVKSQYRTLYRKLGASRREDALRIARAAGLID